MLFRRPDNSAPEGSYDRRTATGAPVNCIQDVDLNKALSVTAANSLFPVHLLCDKRASLIPNIGPVVTFGHELSVGKS
ncbi:Uncharacterised protein [Pseudomonas taetrolens]|nr:Uncharacterised protein [Pseudomonas taetrolens]VEH50934.1 Uncharacterised protein [Pseudomonas taetrolens]